MPSSGFKTCALDRKSTRLNSSHTIISYAVFSLKKKKRGGPDELSPYFRLVQRLSSAVAATSHVFCHSYVFSPFMPAKIRYKSLLFFFLMIRRPPRFTLFPYPTLFRSMIRRPPRSTLFPTDALPISVVAVSFPPGLRADAARGGPPAPVGKLTRPA